MCKFGIIQVKTWWKIGEQIDVKSVEKLVENSVEKSVEKSVKKISGKIGKKAVKKSVEKSVENRWRKSKNVTDGPKDQRTDLHLTWVGHADIFSLSVSMICLLYHGAMFCLPGPIHGILTTLKWQCPICDLWKWPDPNNFALVSLTHKPNPLISPIPVCKSSNILSSHWNFLGSNRRGLNWTHFPPLSLLLPFDINVDPLQWLSKFYQT